MKMLPDLPQSLPSAGRTRLTAPMASWLTLTALAGSIALAVPGALAAQAVRAAPAASTAPTSPASSVSGTDEAGFDFLSANLLAGDGMVTEALAAYDEAAKAHPESAYIHLEHAQLLARLAQAARLPAAQNSYLRKAGDEIGKARQIAPQNLDVLRGVGIIYLELASQDPSALPTAQEALETVYRGDPDDLQTALNLGRLYLDQQQTANLLGDGREHLCRRRFPRNHRRDPT